jgi:hypothetical protein
MNEELQMYADLILEALEDLQDVTIEVSQENDIETAFATTQDGIKVACWILDTPEDVLEVLVYMIHTGENYNYRMEGSFDNLSKGEYVNFHITNIPN